MNAIGNLILIVAALVYGALFTATVIKTPPRGGDAVVGYAWSLFMGGAVFSLCMLIVTGILAWSGRLEWVNEIPSKRNLIIIAGLVLSILGYMFFLFGENPGDLPMPIRWIVTALPIVIPPVLLAWCFLLLNFKSDSFHPLLLKGPIIFTMATGLTALGFIMALKIKNDLAIAKSKTDFEDRIYQNHLKKIEETDISKDLVFLFVLTDKNHDSEVRNKALAKIKSRADWQEEIKRRLENDWAPEAFTFLASNEVDDTTGFHEAVRKGVLIQANLIRKSIESCRDAYDLYEGRFTWEVDRVLRTVDRFKNDQNTYVSEVGDILKALNKPVSFKKPKLTAVYLVESWLKKNS